MPSYADDEEDHHNERYRNKGTRRNRRPEPWHFDKRVPITLIIAIVIQTCAFIWGAAGMYYRVEDHERRLSKVETFDSTFDNQLRIVSGQIATLEQKVSDELESLTRIEGYLHRGNR